MSSSDYETPQVSTHTEPKAKKEHRCFECDGLILPGEQYVHVKYCLDGSWYEYKSCKDCHDLFKRFDVDTCYGGLIDCCDHDLKLMQAMYDIMIKRNSADLRTTDRFRHDLFKATLPRYYGVEDILCPKCGSKIVTQPGQQTLNWWHGHGSLTCLNCIAHCSIERESYPQGFYSWAEPDARGL